jgi:hypothetical protein
MMSSFNGGYMKKSQNPLVRFFGVPFRVRTYLNFLYLLLAFPLGLIYFTFFVVGISLGLATAILLVGFLILAFVGLGWWAFAVFERYQAIWLLGMDVPPMDKPGSKPVTFWERVKDLLTNPVTWKSLFFLIIKFPWGIFTFVVLVTLVGVSLGLMAAPLVYWWLPDYGVSLNLAFGWQIDALWEALIAFVFGVIFGFFSLHVLNYLAYVSGLFAERMLGNRRPALAPAPDAATAAPMAAIPAPPIPPQPVEAPGTEQITPLEASSDSTAVTASLKPTVATPAPEVSEQPTAGAEAAQAPDGSTELPAG